MQRASHLARHANTVLFATRRKYQAVLAYTTPVNYSDANDLLGKLDVANHQADIYNPLRDKSDLLYDEFLGLQKVMRAGIFIIAQGGVLS